jgi:hypothetical protein
MPEQEMPIPEHTEWQQQKRRFGVEGVTVAGVDMGRSLDAYHAHKKEGAKFAQANMEAAEALHRVLTTYVAKVKKVKGVPSTFVDLVEAYMTNAFKNRHFFQLCGDDAEHLRQTARRFKEAAHRLPPEGATPEQIRAFHGGGAAQDLRAAAERAYHGFELDANLKRQMKGVLTGLERVLAEADRAGQQLLNQAVGIWRTGAGDITTAVERLVG